MDSETELLFSFGRGVSKVGSEAEIVLGNHDVSYVYTNHNGSVAHTLSDGDLVSCQVTR